MKHKESSFAKRDLEPQPKLGILSHLQRKITCQDHLVPWFQLETVRLVASHRKNDAEIPKQKKVPLFKIALQGEISGDLPSSMATKLAPFVPRF